ncbi:MAG TPA: polysaccharide biosynthesis/export family protein [Hyphomicrobiales bacterium]|nr:polysaccharide biosynthesis/export family protein [Hyphomicrobiales bacterium]
MSTRILAAALALALAAAATPVFAAAYLLGPQDKVRVKVYEWRAAKGDVYEWTALNGEFTVGAGGNLALPLIGEVPAAGHAADAVAADIAQRLKAKVGLLSRPDASVEVVQYRPFFVVGAADRPGAYPYQPGLTVLQALGLAGGLRRTMDPDVRQIGREIVSGQGDLMVYAVETRSLIARRARLEAEQHGLDAIVWPPELAQADDPATAQLRAQETLIFDTRREALRTQLQALTQLKGFLESEVQSITQQLALEDRQLALIREDLNSASALREKGLVVAPRVLQLERTEAEAESDRLKMNTAMLQARQEAGKTELTMLDLQNSRHNEIATSLRDTQARLDELAKRAGTAAALVQDAENTVPQVLAERDRARTRQPVFTILRRAGGRTVTTTVSEDAAIEPGDTLRVDLPADPAVADARSAGLLGGATAARPVTTPFGTLVRAPADAASVPQN